VEFSKHQTSGFRVSDIAQRALVKLERYLLDLEENSHAQDGVSTRRKVLSSATAEACKQPSRHTSYSEQNWVKAGCRSRAKNSIHWMQDRSPFTSNYVYCRPQPKHIRDRVLSKDKRQALVLGAEWTTKQLSTVVVIDNIVKDINKEQNNRTLKFNNRKHKARIEEVRQAMTEQREPESNKRPLAYIPRTSSIEDLRSKKSLTEMQDGLPKPIEEVVKEHKRTLARMATAQLLGSNAKSSRIMLDPESK
jgi:hypothetical protein